MCDAHPLCALLDPATCMFDEMARRLPAVLAPEQLEFSHWLPRRGGVLLQRFPFAVCHVADCHAHTYYVNRRPCGHTRYHRVRAVVVRAARRFKFQRFFRFVRWTQTRECAEWYWHPEAAGGRRAKAELARIAAPVSGL